MNQHHGISRHYLNSLNDKRVLFCAYWICIWHSLSIWEERSSSCPKLMPPPSFPYGPFPHIVPTLMSISPVYSTAPSPLNPSLSLAYVSVSLMDKKSTLPGPNLTTPSPSPHTQALEEEVTACSWFFLSV